jgi:GT2 family glycosyltransferase
MYPEIQLIISEKNLGFAGGNNIALTQAKGDYILLLNNDTEVKPDF